jgi:hypothetical protein
VESRATLTISAIVWLGWLALWVVLELLGYWHITPWTTLSEFVWAVEMHWRITQIVFLIGFAILLVHLVARWP